MKKTSIIVPSYNDEKIIKKNISILTKKLHKIKLEYEIIIIDDCSNDKTAGILKDISKNSKRIKIIYNKKNSGKSFSIRKGLNKSKYNQIILIDSDLPYFNAFNKILKKLDEGYEFVFINRRHKKSSITNNSLNFYQICRYLIGNCISLVIKFFLNLNIHGGDTQSGLKGFKKFKNFKKLNFVSTQFFLDLEIMYYYKSLNKKFYSIPTKYKINKKSSIKLFSIKKNFKILAELINVMINLKN